MNHKILHRMPTRVQLEQDAAERARVDYRRETDVIKEKEVAVQNTNRLNEKQRAVHGEFVAAAFNTIGGLYF